MKLVFAYTVYWFALLNRRDEFHLKASQLSRSLHSMQIVTSDLVLIELLNCYSGHGELSRETASRMVKSLRGRAGIVVEPLTRESFDAALEFCSERTDKAWSMTDCSSFLIMQKYAIDSALTFDRHFEQAGFKTLLR